MFPFESVAMAQSAGGGIASNPFFQFIPFILIFVVFYFLLIRPQQKKQQQHQKMLDNLKKGDEVVTTGGMYGTIYKLGDDWLTLEVSEKVRIKLERSQVARLTSDASVKKAKENGEETKTTDEAKTKEDLKTDPQA